MRELCVLTLLALGSVSLQASTPSCNIFHKNHEGWKNTTVGQDSRDGILQQYLRSSQAVYEAWCGTTPANDAVRSQAVEQFVEAYRAERFAEDANPLIRPAMGLEVLALIGLTHELPEGMQRDSRLREAWIQDCQDACFAGYAANSADGFRQRTYGIEVRNDLMDNLKPAPGVESVKHMLWETPIAVLN